MSKHDDTERTNQDNRNHRGGSKRNTYCLPSDSAENASHRDLDPYSTPSLRHLLNVPAGKISAFPDQPHHFLDWLRENDYPAATEETFAPRVVFGRYIQSFLATMSGLKQEIAKVTDLRPYNSGAVLTLDNGCELRADLLVLAMGNFDPAPLPGITKASSDSGGYHHNAWSLETYEGLAPDPFWADSVLQKVIRPAILRLESGK